MPASTGDATPSKDSWSLLQLSFESDATCGGNGSAVVNFSFASTLGRRNAVEDSSGSQWQTSPHRRQFMGTNSDDNSVHNLGSQFGLTIRRPDQRRYMPPGQPRRARTTAAGSCES